MNLRELIASTRTVKTNMWDPSKDFRSREFGAIIDFDIKGRYNAHFKTLTVTMYIKSKTQGSRSISNALGDSTVSTHTAAITFKDIEEHVVYIQDMVAQYNATSPEEPIETVQDIITKMQATEPDLVPVEITDEYILFRTRVDLDTECRVKCTCAHFYYTFAYYCAQAGAYIGDAIAPYKARRKLKGKYRFRNSNGVPGLCKHLQLLITHILKTDNGVNGNMEYANSKIDIPASIKGLIAPEKGISSANRTLEAYENGDNEFITKNRNNYVKLALRELKQFNSAVRQQKSENHGEVNYSEVDNNGLY